MPNLEALVHALNEPMMVLDTAGRILLATESVQALTGTSKSPILADAIAREDRARFKEVFGRIMAGELPSLTLTLQLAPLGIKPLPIALKLAPIISADGQIDTIGAWLRDMSQESKILSAQQILHEQLSTLMEHISDGCILENAEGRIELINAAVCHIFGLVEAPVSLIDTAVADLFALTAKATHVALTYTPPSAEMAAQRGFAVIAGQQIQHQTVPLHAESKLVGCLHVFSRLGATSEATSSTAAQMTLIENIVQQLAMTVEGAGKAIKRAEQLELPVQVLAHFHQVERAAQSAFSSVAGLLDFAQVDSSPIKLDNDNFNLRQSIAAMLESLLPELENQAIQLRLTIEQDVPETLTGDGPRLILALRNLMICALPGAMPGAQLTLCIEAQYATDHVIHLTFRVEHTQPSGTLRSAALTPTGTMQLALARQIVRAVSVSSTASNSDDRAGQISVHVAAEGVSYQFAAAFHYTGQKQTRTRPTFVTLTGVPVLIVNANADERRQLTEMLHNCRMSVYEADDAAMALHLLSRALQEGNPIPLMITSNQLPIQDGFVLAFRIHHHPTLHPTAIMMLARTGKVGDALACQENGICAYLRHPIAPNQLQEAITAVLCPPQDNDNPISALVTRHSLREGKAGTVLIVDNDHDHAMLASGALKKHAFRVVLANGLKEALTALEQDVFDVAIIRPDTTNLQKASSIVAQLRISLSGSAKTRFLLAADIEPATMPNEFDALVQTPYSRDTLLSAIQSVLKK